MSWGQGAASAVIDTPDAALFVLGGDAAAIRASGVRWSAFGSENVHTSD